MTQRQLDHGCLDTIGQKQNKTTHPTSTSTRFIFHHDCDEIAKLVWSLTIHFTDPLRRCRIDCNRKNYLETNPIGTTIHPYRPRGVIVNSCKKKIGRRKAIHSTVCFNSNNNNNLPFCLGRLGCTSGRCMHHMCANQKDNPSIWYSIENQDFHVDSEPYKACQTILEWLSRQSKAMQPHSWNPSIR